MVTAFPPFLVEANLNVATSLSGHRARFDRDARNYVAVAITSGTSTGSARWEFMHQACARELGERACMFASAAIAAHARRSEAPSTDLLAAAIDWIDTKIAATAIEVAMQLSITTAASDRDRTLDTLDVEVIREKDNAHERLNAEWTRLKRSRVERAKRWFVREGRGLMAVLRA